MRPQEGNKHQKHTLSQMKIQYALVSCNAEPRYTAYWPTTAAAWLKLGITPVCLFIPDDPSHKLPAAPEGSIVHTIPPLSDVHIMPQVVMLRFWASYLYPDAAVIINDMDFVPLSRPFFQTQLAAYPEHAYIHMGPSSGPSPWTHMTNIPEKITHINKVRYLLVCFHVAKGRVMQKILNLSPDWEASCKKSSPTIYKKVPKLRSEGSHISHAERWCPCLEMKYIPLFASIIPVILPSITSHTKNLNIQARYGISYPLSAKA